MPRNSLINGKPAPDTLRHPARRVRLPDPDGARGRAHRPRLLRGPHQAGGGLRRRARPVVRPRALGGAERLLAVDDRRRDRRPGRRRRRSPTATATTPRAARLARRRPTSSSATSRRWTLTTNGPLGPQPYFIRLSKNGDPNAAITYNLGNGGPDARPARGDRRRLPRVRPARRAAGRRPRHRRARSPSSTRTIRRDTASGDGFYRYNGDGYGDRAHATARPWAPSRQQGHRPPVAGAGRRARPVRARPAARPARRSRLRGDGATWPPASG